MSTKSRGLSPESKAKISAALKGRTFTPEHRAKLAAAKIGNKNAAGHKLPIESRKFGEEHAHWVGDDASYAAVHRRVQVRFGPATKYSCVDCGRPAQEWSYIGGCPNEQTSLAGFPYSTDVERYSARCIRDHRRHDSNREQVA